MNYVVQRASFRVGLLFAFEQEQLVEVVMRENAYWWLDTDHLEPVKSGLVIQHSYQCIVIFLWILTTQNQYAFAICD